MHQSTCFMKLFLRIRQSCKGKALLAQRYIGFKRKYGE